ncbi:MAG: hypothetical protein ACLP8S_06820 [Solirubrobacteraceae bacterium]
MQRGGRNLIMLAASIATAAAALAVVPASGASTPGSYAVSARLIAFVRETNTSPPVVWVADGNGSHARKLGNGDLPAVAPGGSMVAAERESGGVVFLYSTSGAPMRTFRTSGDPVAFAWSPDSRYLAVEIDSTALNGVTGAGLAVIDTTTNRYKMVARGDINGAGFAVNGSDRIVYGSSPSLNQSAPANLYTIDPDGSAHAQITHDGVSLDPIWGAKGIAFDREQRRGQNAGPAYQVWLLNGTHLQQLTHMSIPSLLAGLVPVAFSANGNRMIAGYEGEDTNYAWTIQISPLRVRQIPGFVQAGGISQDGNSLLIDSGAFMQSADHGTVESIPFAASHPVQKLVRGALPSWNL